MIRLISATGKVRGGRLAAVAVLAIAAAVVAATFWPAKVPAFDPSKPFEIVDPFSECMLEQMRSQAASMQTYAASVCRGRSGNNVIEGR